MNSPKPAPMNAQQVRRQNAVNAAQKAVVIRRSVQDLEGSNEDFKEMFGMTKREFNDPANAERVAAAASEMIERATEEARRNEAIEFGRKKPKSATKTSGGGKQAAPSSVGAIRKLQETAGAGGGGGGGDLVSPATPPKPPKETGKAKQDLITRCGDVQVDCKKDY